MDVYEPLTSYGVTLQPSAPPKQLLSRPRAMHMSLIKMLLTKLYRGHGE
jgi:hypothetical protein